MARYRYKAVDPAGRERIGFVDAAGEAAARADLKKKRLLPLELAQTAGEAAGKSTAPAGARVGGLSHKARLVITRQLATLIDAAVPVDEALGMVAAQQEQPRVRRLVERVQGGVVEGLRLADALGRAQGAFPSLYRAAVAGGERSGRLGFVLTRLADYLARAHALRTKVLTALVYPAALSLVAATVITCLMIFVVPTLTEQFKTYETKLPLLTQILVATSDLLVHFWPLLLIGLVGLGLVLRAALARESVRFALDAAMLRAPVIGKRLMEVNASRFVRAVATLTLSGLPVLESVRAARDSAPNRVFAKAVGAMADGVEEGEPLSFAMRKSGVVPVMIVYMAQSGENAGELPGMLEKAADHLDQEFEAFTAAALSLLEPAIIIVMGAVVASIVLAIMLPVLQLNQLAVG